MHLCTVVKNRSFCRDPSLYLINLAQHSRYKFNFRINIRIKVRINITVLIKITACSLILRLQVHNQIRTNQKAQTLSSASESSFRSRSGLEAPNLPGSRIVIYQKKGTIINDPCHMWKLTRSIASFPFTSHWQTASSTWSGGGGPANQNQNHKQCRDSSNF